MIVYSVILLHRKHPLGQVSAIWMVSICYHCTAKTTRYNTAVITFNRNHSIQTHHPLSSLTARWRRWRQRSVVLTICWPKRTAYSRLNRYISVYIENVKTWEKSLAILRWRGFPSDLRGTNRCRWWSAYIRGKSSIRFCLSTVAPVDRPRGVQYTKKWKEA